MKDGKRCSGSVPYGYYRLEGDKQTLIVDPVAAEVVKRIFLLANEGKKPEGDSGNAHGGKSADSRRLRR